MSHNPSAAPALNKFQLGMFGLNCSGGLTSTTAPERWSASWDDTVRAARVADESGLDFMLPIGRWRGFGGKSDRQGNTFETLTWATGLLQATQRVSVFGTVHVSLIHPVFAAKQVVTADHVGHGRFGLNVVSGWNVGEFSMFGAELLEHDERYEYTEEWITIVRRIWRETDPFDFKGKYFDLQSVIGRPKPVRPSGPKIMSAGSSPAGRAFAGRHADALFMVIVDGPKLQDEIEALRSAAQRPVGVFASGHMMSRRTEKETREFYDYIVNEKGDWEAAEQVIEARIAGGGQSIPPERIRSMKERFISGGGTYPVIGSYDNVAQTFKNLSDAGLNGMALGLVNYVEDGAVLRDEILPRMERLGLRAPHQQSALAALA